MNSEVSISETKNKRKSIQFAYGGGAEAKNMKNHEKSWKILKIHENSWFVGIARGASHLKTRSQISRKFMKTDHFRKKKGFLFQLWGYFKKMRKIHENSWFLGIARGASHLKTRSQMRPLFHEFWGFHFGDQKQAKIDPIRLWRRRGSQKREKSWKIMKKHENSWKIMISWDR